MLGKIIDGLASEVAEIVEAKNNPEIFQAIGIISVDALLKVRQFYTLVSLFTGLAIGLPVGSLVGWVCFGA